MAGKLRHKLLTRHPGLFDLTLSALLFSVASIRRCLFRSFRLRKYVSCINGGSIAIHHKTDLFLKNARIHSDGGPFFIGTTYGFFDGGGVHSRTDVCRIHLSDGSLSSQGEVSLYAGVTVNVTGGAVRIGAGTKINSFTKIIAKKEVTIGGDCMIAQGVVIRDDDGHRFFDGEKFENKIIPVHIGSKVWIGQNAIILKGSYIGDGAVIAAGAVVSGEVPANTVVGGVPAKTIKSNIQWEA